jgi:hypothetical protein
MSSTLLRRLQGWWRRPDVTPAGAASYPVVHDVPQTHDEVEHYWTDERMSAARAAERKLPLPGDDDA